MILYIYIALFTISSIVVVPYASEALLLVPAIGYLALRQTLLTGLTMGLFKDSRNIKGIIAKYRQTSKHDRFILFKLNLFKLAAVALAYSILASMNSAEFIALESPIVATVAVILATLVYKRGITKLDLFVVIGVIIGTVIIFWNSIGSVKPIHIIILLIIGIVRYLSSEYTAQLKDAFTYTELVVIGSIFMAPILIVWAWVIGDFAYLNSEMIATFIPLLLIGTFGTTINNLAGSYISVNVSPLLSSLLVILTLPLSLLGSVYIAGDTLTINQTIGVTLALACMVAHRVLAQYNKSKKEVKTEAEEQLN